MEWLLLIMVINSDAEASFQRIRLPSETLCSDAKDAVVEELSADSADVDAVCIKIKETKEQ